MRSLFIVALVSLFAAPYAAASPVTYQPVAVAPGDVSYQDNVALTQSIKANSSVGVRPPAAENTRERPVFWLAIRNTGPSPITIGPDDVTVVTNTGAAVQAISAEELQREANAIRFAAAARAARNATSAANVAATNASTGNHGASIQTGSVNSPNGGDRSGAAAPYDPNAGALAIAPANAPSAQTTQNADPNADGLVSQTLAPRTQIVAPITLDRLPAHTAGLTLTVHVGDDVHVFQWSFAQR